VAATVQSRIPDVLKQYQAQILEEWLKAQAAGGLRPDLLSNDQVKAQSVAFLRLLTEAAQKDGSTDFHSPAWAEARQMTTELSRSRADLGFTPFETAMFVFSLKEPFLNQLQQHIPDGDLAREITSATRLLDGLGLLTMEAYQKTRDDVIRRQQQEIMELSTPVVKVWDGIVAVPLIGSLDSARTQVVMESLLEGIIAHGAQIAIIDITGVPTVDTLVAQHLIKAVAAARLMGAECIISGIRPQIAQTMVQLGIELQNVITKASLADAIRLAFDRLGIRMVRD
jgi:rsbT co-antagonist protein RsbR